MLLMKETLEKLKRDLRKLETAAAFAPNSDYFVRQSLANKNCVTLAINNLFGEGIVTRESLLRMKIKNRKNKLVQVCEAGSAGGLRCQNQVIEHVLGLVQDNKIKVSRSTTNFYQESIAFTWLELRKAQKLAVNKFDTFFEMYHPYILGVYGNRPHTAGIEHAVSIRRNKNGTLWLYDSLEEERKRVSSKGKKWPSAFYNISPFVLIMKNEFLILQIMNLS
jgi:hypothetical protein